MRKIFLLAMAATMVTIGANAKKPISGQIYNADTGEALPYVTVAVKGRGIGVISDRDGRFEIRGGEGLSPADSIAFSHVGFDTEVCTVGELTGDGQEISLRPGRYEIEQIVVTNRRSRLAKLGHSSGGTRMFSVPFLTPQDIAEGVRRGREVGTAIKIKQDTEVLSLGFLINANKYDEAKFRVSLYALAGETPGELLVNRVDKDGRYHNHHLFERTDIQVTAIMLIFVSLCFCLSYGKKVIWKTHYKRRNDPKCAASGSLACVPAHFIRLVPAVVHLETGL